MNSTPPNNSSYSWGNDDNGAGDSTHPETTTFNPQTDYQPAGQPVHPAYEQPQKRSSALPTILAILLALALVALGAMAYFLLRDNNEGSSSSEPTTAEQETTQEQQSDSTDEFAADEAAKSEQESTTAEQERAGGEVKSQRAAQPQLPPGAVAANDAARAGKPAGDFNNVYRDSQQTSEAFAQSVRDAYVDNYVRTGDFNATVQAYSPATGMTYTMDCNDNGNFVTCTGGNRAIVYIA